MPYRVILLKGNEEIGSKTCETRTEAAAYVRGWQSFRRETISAIIVDEDSSEIVLPTEQANDSSAPRS
jgi:hypothetical protein